MAAPSTPTEPSVPISYPITDLETLISRSYFKSFHFPFNVSSVPLPAASVATPPRRRILVCHDFKGGYTEDDKWVQGGANAGAYAIWHWHLMDIFVYFSHYLVTLPPPGWIDAAHTHGVKVLGTFITEWEKGREICNTLLSTTEFARTYAERLAELADTLGFDGWLINMEVSLYPQQILNLKEFVGHLTQTMHKVVPGSLVIWYDSVTIHGKLDYQNQLNEKNKPFFDICDGIFCNYGWKKNYPKYSGTVAGDRRFDVYMGIDVWGRGTYGGGQWNDGCTKLNKDQTSKPHKIGGFQVADNPWNNMACQGFQAVPDCKESSQSSMQVFINFEDESYIGGGSITCKGSLGINDIFSTRIFVGKLTLVQSFLTYYVKSDENSLMGLELSFSPDSTGITKVAILPESMLPTGQLTIKYDRIILAKRSSHRNLSLRSNWIQYESNILMKGQTMTEFRLLCYLKNPVEANTSSSNKMTAEIVDGSPYDASLGLLRLQISGQSIEFPSADSWITQGENISWSSKNDRIRTVSLKITWKLKAGSSQAFVVYNIYVGRVSNDINEQDFSTDSIVEFLATTKAGVYYISALEVPIGVTYLNFVIQVCAVDGTYQDLDKCPRYQLAVEG